VHTNEDLPTIIGQNVTVGHLSLLEGCVIEDGAIVGMGSIVLNRARVGQRTMLAAGSVVTEDGEIPSEVLAAGAPAEAKKELDGSSAKWVEEAAREYQALRLRYMKRAAGPATTAAPPGKEERRRGANSKESVS